MSWASGYIFDIDGTDQLTLTAYSDDGITALAQMTLTKNSPEAGEGRSAPWRFDRSTSDITQIRIAGAGTQGFDHFESSYTPPPPQPATLGIDTYAGLLIEGEIGRPYRIDYADHLTPTNWIALTNIILPSSPFLFFDTTSIGPPQRFYRAVGLQ